MSEYGAGNDGCEWDPTRQRAALEFDTHFNEHQATVMLGAGKRMFRLCESCSRLPRFARLRKRRPIVRRTNG